MYSNIKLKRINKKIKIEFEYLISAFSSDGAGGVNAKSAPSKIESIRHKVNL